MGAPSDQFLHLLWRPPYVLFHTIWGPSDHFLHTILGPPDHFLRLLYGAPHISFFSYNIGAPLRSVSLLTICPPPLQISFFACYRGGHLRFYFFSKYMGASSDQFLRLLYGVPLRLVSLLTIWAPPPDQFLCLLCGGPFKLVSSHTI